MNEDINARGGKRTEPSPIKIDIVCQALVEGK